MTKQAKPKSAPSVLLYTSHHKPSAFLTAAAVRPLHVGKALSYNDICCPGDDSGDNISCKNPFYCELTAQYWVWKQGGKSDYVGFMHYRRHLNFSTRQDYPEDNWGVVAEEEINAAYEEKFALDETGIRACLEGVDILLPKKWSVRRAGSKDNYDHYRVSEHLHIGDYQAALDCLLRRHPEYGPAVEAFNAAHEGYYTNMFVMRREIFEHYSQWLFPILSDLEDNFSMLNYSAQERRLIGHIAERLLNIYVIHQLGRRDLKVKEVQRTFVQRETFNGRLRPAFTGACVPLAMCFDDSYAISGGALLRSIVANSTAGSNYDVVILENGISERNKARLMSLVKGHGNFSLRFFDVNAFGEMRKVHTRAHFSAVTYARLFIPQLFRDYRRVLFIDADTIVESDVAELIDVPMADNLVAAVKDLVMEGIVKFGTLVDTEGYRNVPARDYLHKALGMADPGRYFQAGIIVFNVAQMLEEHTFEALMQAMQAQKYWFLDQDIMNKVFYGRVHYLPLEWNVYHGNGNADELFPNLTFSTYMRFLEARRQPKMIHYAGENKPWNTAEVDFFDNFARYISDTPWQQEFYHRLPEASGGKRVAASLPLTTRVERMLKQHVNRIAPVGTRRRQVFRKYYHILRRTISAKDG